MTPDILPADFFDQASAGGSQEPVPDTLPPDFFAKPKRGRGPKPKAVAAPDVLPPDYFEETNREEIIQRLQAGAGPADRPAGEEDPHSLADQGLPPFDKERTLATLKAGIAGQSAALDKETLPWYRRAASSLGATFGLEHPVDAFNADVKGVKERGLDYVGEKLWEGTKQLNPFPGHIQTANAAVEQMKQPGINNKVQGAYRYAQSGIPFYGPGMDKAGEQFKEGDWAGGGGTMLGIGTQVVTGTPLLRGNAAGLARSAASEIKGLPAKVNKVGVVEGQPKPWYQQSMQETMQARKPKPAPVAESPAEMGGESAPIKRVSDVAGKVYESLPESAKAKAPIPASHLPRIAEKRAELGPLGDAISDRTLAEGTGLSARMGPPETLANKISRAANSSNPIESAAARAIGATQEILGAPEAEMVRQQIAKLPPVVEPVNALFDAAQKNESPWGSIKATMNKQAFRSVAGYLKTQGEAGDLFGRALHAERSRAEALQGRFSAGYITILGEELLGLAPENVGASSTIKALGKRKDVQQKFVEVVDIIEGRNTGSPSPEVVRAADRISKLFDEVFEDLSRAGVEEEIPVMEKQTDGRRVRVISEEFEKKLMAEEGARRVGDRIMVPVMHRKNYWPHSFDAEILDRPQVFAEMRAQLVKDGVVQNEAAAERYIRQIILPRAERLAGNIQRSRLTNASHYRKDPAVVLEYLGKASKKIAERELFGGYVDAGMPVEASKIIDQIRAEGGDYHFANDVARRHFGVQAVDPSMNAAANVLVSYAVASQMSLATIANLGQMTNAAWRPQMRTVVSAIRKTAGSFDQVEMQALRDGAIVPTVHKELMSALGLRSRPGGISFWKDPASTVLKYNGFLTTENWNRVTSYTTGRVFAHDVLPKLLKNPKNPKYRAAFKDWMGLDPDRIVKQGKLYDSDLAHAGKFYAEKTQFRSGLPDLPYVFGSSPWWRVLLLYKSFGYNQARLFSGAVRESIKTGNFKLLAKAIGLPIVAGEAVQGLRGLITGKDREDSMLLEKYGMVGRLVEDMSYGAGMGLMTDALMSLTYDSKGAVLNMVSGPVLGKAGNLIGAAYQDLLDALEDKPDERDVSAGVRSLREAAATIPGVAPLAKRSVTALTESKAEKAKRLNRRLKVGVSGVLRGPL